MFGVNCSIYSLHYIGYGAREHRVIANDKHMKQTQINFYPQFLDLWTLSQQLLQMILKKSATTSHIWKSIDDLFWDNKDAKVIGLDNEFRNIVMGDSSVIEYCSRIKTILHF